jgi:malate dehydrogenase (oxaloacetate-decarboxylating)(NADP+)
LEPTFGGINLEDIKGPECFYIEQALKKKLNIPVFHDDQHGTAIISGAALMNAAELVGKKLEDMKVVYNGAGASGIACAKFHISLGVNPKNVILCDSAGAIYKGRTKGMNEFKEDFAIETEVRTLAEALVGADVFCGLSIANCVTGDMIKKMAPNPVIFAMANPDPEITYEEAMAARNDIIFATGRSDYPNQVNNVLGFPFIFRGAMDVYARAINEEMKQAASYALAKLAKEDVPESVKKAYGVDEMSFGREYIIPKPFDPRVLTWVAPAVAKAAMETGVARREIKDWDEYVRSLNIRMGRAERIMSKIYQKARSKPKRIVFPEGTEPKIIKAAQLCLDEKIGTPILIGNEEKIRSIAENMNYDIEGIEIINPKNFEGMDKYIAEYHKLRHRKGLTIKEAEKRMLTRPNYFGAMMVRMGDADTMLSGLTSHYPDTLKPAIQIVGKDKKYDRISGSYILSTKKGTYFFADTTVNINPTSEQIADITLMTADFAKVFEITPRVALISYSNFGSTRDEESLKMQNALKLIHDKRPDLMVDGEMQADTAVMPEIIEKNYPFSTLKGGANVLIFPNLSAGNASYKLLARIGGAHTIGPVLQGFSKSIHVLQMGDDVTEILNMAAIAVVDAQNKVVK